MLIKHSMLKDLQLLKNSMNFLLLSSIHHIENWLALNFAFERAKLVVFLDVFIVNSIFLCHDMCTGMFSVVIGSMC